MPAPKSHPNLTRAGEGRPKAPDRVALNTTVNKATKAGLKRIGKIGATIDRIYREWSERGLEIQRLQRQIEALEDKAQGLEPTDSP